MTRTKPEPRTKPESRTKPNPRTKTIATFVFLHAVLLHWSCSEESSDSNITADTTTAQKSDTASTVPDNSNGLLFKGFVPSAFDVTVDGTAYLDLEDFYTQELSRLPQRVKEAGYADGYAIKFDAEIGFSDLWTDMAVYIVSENDRGYFGKGQVESDGSFSIGLPPGNSEGSYKVRANKRIGIVLSKNDDVINICYNFSAIDQSVSFDEQQKPIILSDFITKLTTYACPTAQSGDGLEIPGSSTNGLIKLEIGMAKRMILDNYGSDNVLIQSSTQWCFTSSSFELNKYCAIESYATCQCSIQFDDKGNLSSVDNISIDFLGDSLIY